MNYLIKVKEYSFVEAVEAPAGITASWSPPPVSTPKDEAKELLLPTRNSDCDRVIQYLFGRGIDFQKIGSVLRMVRFMKVPSIIMLKRNVLPS